jgi:hypothetical protein
LVDREIEREGWRKREKIRKRKDKQADRQEKLYIWGGHWQGLIFFQKLITLPLMRN